MVASTQWVTTRRAERMRRSDRLSPLCWGRTPTVAMEGRLSTVRGVRCVLGVIAIREGDVRSATAAIRRAAAAALPVGPTGGYAFSPYSLRGNTHQLTNNC